MIARYSYISNYYPFGMVMKERSWEATSTDKYRFSFNGNCKNCCFLMVYSISVKMERFERKPFILYFSLSPNWRAITLQKKRDKPIINWIRPFWRRLRDSNSRYSYPYTNFPGLLLKPLGQVSIFLSLRR